MASKETQTKKLLKEIGEKNIMAQDVKDAKFYQYSEEINGTNYVFQYCGKRKALQVTDEASTGQDKVSKEKLIDEMLKLIVVSPSVDLDYFDEEDHMDDFDRVVEIANVIFGGKFRNSDKLKTEK